LSAIYGNVERAQRLGDDVAAERRRVGAVGNLKPLDLVKSGLWRRMDFGAMVLTSSFGRLSIRAPV
jgi:hypothetical protein